MTEIISDDDIQIFPRVILLKDWPKRLKYYKTNDIKYYLLSFLMLIYSVMSFSMKFCTIIAIKYIMLSTEISVILINKVSFIDIGVTDDELLISFSQLSFSNNW